MISLGKLAAARNFSNRAGPCAAVSRRLAVTLLFIGMNQAGSESVDGISEYYITCDPDSFSYIYENFKRDHYIPVHFSHGEETWYDARMRIRGDSSRELEKKSLKIWFPTRPFLDGREKLNFNAEFLDKSYLRTVLASRLFMDTGHPGFLAEHARIFLNDEFFGLYVRVENMDKDFLRRNDLNTDGNLYKAYLDGASLTMADDISIRWEKKTNDDGDRSDLRNLIFLLNQVPRSEFLNFARGYFHYDRMINSIALNMLLANGSTYYHNYYMFHDIGGDGKWSMFPWDTDKTFSKYGLNYPYHRSYQPPRHPGRWDNPFLERALQNDTMLADIQARVGELNQTYFNPGYLFALIDSLQAVLEPSVAQDRTDDVANLAQWKKQIEAERSYIQSRASRLREQFEKWPSPFQVLGLRWIDETPWLVWGPSENSTTYTLKYGKEHTLPEDVTRTIEGLTDTAYALPPELAAGRYFWNVEAFNSHGSFEAYDSKATFVFSRHTRKRTPKTPDFAVINELNYRSADDFDPGDWIELYNPQHRTIDVSGWYLKDNRDDHAFFIPNSTFIARNSYLVLCQDQDDFLALFPEIENCAGDWDFGLDRASESVRIFNSEGTLIDFVAYSNEPPWPAEADGTGSTLQLAEPESDNRFAANWGPSSGHGSPGQTNFPILLPAGEAMGSYPNPFNESTTISFFVSEGARCSLGIFDIRGGEIIKLVDEWRSSGFHQVTWDGHDQRNDRVASGLYIAHLKGPEGIGASRKIILVR